MLSHSPGTTSKMPYLGFHRWIEDISYLQCLLQGSRFLKFVIEAARIHFASARFEKLSVPQKFGPTFFTTIFVSRERNTRDVKFVTGPIRRPKGEDD